ncbi:MAG: hypothetical protein ACJAQ3_001197, partial [Planctomycetota bacterium]
RHDREGWKVPVGSVDVDLVVELRSADAGPAIDARLREEGFEVMERQRRRLSI